jgi:hypothetical protein
MVVKYVTLFCLLSRQSLSFLLLLLKLSYFGLYLRSNFSTVTSPVPKGKRENE